MIRNRIYDKGHISLKIDITGSSTSSEESTEDLWFCGQEQQRQLWRAIARNKGISKLLLNIIAYMLSDPRDIDTIKIKSKTNHDILQNEIMPVSRISLTQYPDTPKQMEYREK